MTLMERLNRPAIVLLAVAALAGVIRFTALTRPPELIFDETYYAKSGCLFIGGGLQECQIKSDDEKYWVNDKDDVGAWVHPPAGKWMIGLGELAFGMDPFGWRFAAALFGTLGVVIAAAMAIMLFRSNLWGLVTGVLLATESLHVVQSRVALLDIFLATWVSLAFLFLLLDRRWIERRDKDLTEATAVANAREGPSARALEEPVPRVASPIWRPWRFAAGITFGLATATKWSGGTALVGGIILAFVWERTRRKRARKPHPIARALQSEGFGIFLALVLIPIGVYVLCWARWWIMHGAHPFEWFQLQVDMAKFHIGLDRLKDNGKLTHPYESLPWTWPFLARPVDFYFKGPGAEVLSIGNPIIFWSSLIAVPVAVWAWARRKDWKAGFIVVAIMAQYLPWFLQAGRVQFLFYMTPIVPFMVLAIVYGLKILAEIQPIGARRRPYVPLVVAFVLVSVAVFAFQYPILTGLPLTESAWHARIWFPSWV